MDNEIEDIDFILENVAITDGLSSRSKYHDVAKSQLETLITNRIKEELEAKEKQYFDSVLRARAKTDPDMTIKEWHDGHFAKHNYKGA